MSDVSAAETLRSRVMVAHALCAIAESEAHGKQADRALATIAVIRNIIREIRARMEPPSHLALSSLRELSDFCRELEHRLRNIEQILISSE